jgi:hypothetical protein
MEQLVEMERQLLQLFQLLQVILYIFMWVALVPMPQ